MKLKRLPEDFQVEELTQFAADGGSFAFYRLTKQSIGTPEAIEAIARRLHVPRQRISYGGLKDKHAVTRQYLTILNGPRKNLEQTGFDLTYVSQSEHPFGPKDIAGNRFRIVIRDLSADDLTQAKVALTEVIRDGLPNYFDDQRFGSVGSSGEFIAQPWCAGDYERALWLALADAHEDDRSEEREQKKILRDLWGKWAECKAALARSNRRSIITYLADKPSDKPSDFRGAFARMRVDLRSLYLSAFQSFLWNQLLAATLRSTCAADQLVDVPLKTGPIPFFRSLASDVKAQLLAQELPLPSARLHLEEGALMTLFTDVLAPFGLELRQLRVKYPRDSFFSKGSRRSVIPLEQVTQSEEPDELYAKKFKLTLQFELPRGSYATILVKRLTECTASSG